MKKYLFALVCLFSAFLFSACAKISLFGDNGAGPAPPQARISPLEEASQAYVSGNYGRAESIALRLTSDPGASPPNKTAAARLLAAAALKNAHPAVALSALDDWRKGDPGADGGIEWQDAWAKALRSLSSTDARTRADALYQDSRRSIPVRSMAGIVLAVRQWRDGDLGQSTAALENIYDSAAGAGEKAALERRMALELHLADPSASALAYGTVTNDNRAGFPFNVILLDKLRRDSLQADTRGTATAMLRDIAGKLGLADLSLAQKPPEETEIRIHADAGRAPSAPVSGRPVVLLLPLSGQYVPISEKIADGAKVACDEMNAAGRQASLVVIDTGQADWVARVDSLPADALVVGGPLRREDFAKAKAAGITSRRAVFAFLPSLEPGDEGHSAWRFFAGPKDQADALLDFTSRLGIKGYGIFYPEDNFGRRMAALFEERARASGATEVVVQSYEPGNQNDWMAATNKLLAANNKGSVFRAVFLPDTWKNMDVIVPNFFYQNETRQVLLGTSLWEQGLSAGGFVSTQYYTLAVFPGLWNAAYPMPAGQRLQAALSAAGKSGADFWSALGYDFARLSAGLGIGDVSPQAVNAALQSADLDWSIAPISWNAGIASQRMHLFTPAAGGFAPVDEREFRAAYEDAWR
ncbi:MAG: penicillin-binding protein activator [Desulfovibrio sp.]|jgi:ABC-type branched-subunit amino acid transport system substrate-binding protein|nr:penicillin-binding protein activator [Desulfovibrio sp.]